MLLKKNEKVKQLLRRNRTILSRRKIHEHLDTFKCDSRSKVFGYFSNFKKHSENGKTKHANLYKKIIQEIKSKKCNFSTYSNRCLVYHQVLHSERFQWQNCQHQFYKSKDLKKH